MINKITQFFPRWVSDLFKSSHRIQIENAFRSMVARMEYEDKQRDGMGAKLEKYLQHKQD